MHNLILASQAENVALITGITTVIAAAITQQIWLKRNVGKANGSGNLQDMLRTAIDLAEASQIIAKSNQDNIHNISAQAAEALGYAKRNAEWQWRHEINDHLRFRRAFATLGVLYDPDELIYPEDEVGVQMREEIGRVERLLGNAKDAGS